VSKLSYMIDGQEVNLPLPPASPTGKFLKDDGTWDTPSGGDELNPECWFPIWAEENAAISAGNYEWAFGNGANSAVNDGITLFVPSGWVCTLEAMSLCIGAGTGTVQAVINQVSQGANANVSVATGKTGTNSFAPVSISSGDLFNFRTEAASGTASPCVVTAWFKMVKS